MNELPLLYPQNPCLFSLELLTWICLWHTWHFRHFHENFRVFVHLMQFTVPVTSISMYIRWKVNEGGIQNICRHKTPGSWIFQVSQTKRKISKSLTKTFKTLLSLSYRYYFGGCSSELSQLVPLPFSLERSICYFDRLHDFSFTIPRCYKDVYVNSFFLCTVRPWNFLPIECFPLTYNLNGFKSRINRHLLTVDSF